MDELLPPTPAVSAYLADLDVLISSPDLAEPEKLLLFYYRFYAQIVRFENNYKKKGLTEPFSPLEIAFLLEEISDRISQTRAKINETKNP